MADRGAGGPMQVPFPRALILFWIRVERWLIEVPFSLGLLAACFLVLTRVVVRDLRLGDPAQLTAFTQYLFVWGTWLGMGYALRNGWHVQSIDVLRRFGPRVVMAAATVRLAALWAFGAIALWQGGDLTIRQFESGFPSEDALGWPLFTLSICVPAGGLILLIDATIRSLADARPKPSQSSS